MMNILRMRIYGILLLSLYCYHVNADNTMNFKGTLIHVPCYINGQQPVDISFGNVGVNKVDGVSYKKNVPFNLTCDGDIPATLMLSVTGTAVDFNDAAVESSATDLGIEIRANDQKLPLNQKLSITTTSLPTLTATPVKRPDSTLTAGSFTATVTLIVENV